MKRDAKPASSFDVPSADLDGRSNVAFMLAILDTTWRMFTPSVGLMLLGVWLDGQYDAKPWYTIIGTVFGLLCSVLLVKKQLYEVVLHVSKKGPKT